MSGRELLKPVWVRGFEGSEMSSEELWALSLAQKSWLKRAWESEFGFVPEAIPRYTEERGFFYVPAIKVHWHHIRGVAISIYNDGEDPHRPKNIVPLSARSHIGKGVGPWEVEDNEEVIHESALAALRSYPFYKEAGGMSPFEVMREEGRLLARRGLTRHFSLWDRHFEDLAMRVTEAYLAENQGDYWPKTKWRG
ncbi:MAG: hypothetical protein AAB548_02995 [Patescibacteria group bacterium]